MNTLIANDEPGLTREDCLEYLGEDRTVFVHFISEGFRLGQSYFLALTSEDQEKLRGSFVDPFHRDDWTSVIRALAFLLEN